MGEIAEMILEGILCEQCGMFIDGEEVGFPRLCDFCRSDEFEQAFGEPSKPLTYKGKIRGWRKK